MTNLLMIAAAALASVAASPQTPSDMRYEFTDTLVDPVGYRRLQDDVDAPVEGEMITRMQLVTADGHAEWRTGEWRDGIFRGQDLDLSMEGGSGYMHLFDSRTTPTPVHVAGATFRPDGGPTRTIYQIVDAKGHPERHLIAVRVLPKDEDQQARSTTERQ